MASIMTSDTIRVGTTRSNLSGKEYKVRFTSSLFDITMFEMELATRVYIEKEIPTYQDGQILPRDIERIRQINILSITETLPEKPKRTPRF